VATLDLALALGSYIAWVLLAQLLLALSWLLALSSQLLAPRPPTSWSWLSALSSWL
jgi:hypothetical protein